MTYPEIRREDLSNPDTPRSKEMSPEEFQMAALQGHVKYQLRAAQASPPEGLDKNWNAVVDRAHEATRQPWGGMTVDSHTGKDLPSDADVYALSAKEPDTPQVSVTPGANKEEFAGGMQRAREEYSHILSRKDHHLGVFHDADRDRIDIDPILVVRHKMDVDQIGAYTRAVGGAYHPKSGDGHWPPHVTGG